MNRFTSRLRLGMLPLPAGLVERAGAWVSTSIDDALFLRLAAMRVTAADMQGVDAVDPAGYWADSRVADPAPVRVFSEGLARRQGRVRVLDLEGESHGPGSHPGARRLTARAYIQRGAADAPFVLLLHGFAVPTPHYEDWHARQLLARGFNVARLDLPFHMRRRLRDGVSGDGFFSPDLSSTRDVVRQAVEDSAAVVAWARQEVSSQAAVMGTSLGGLVTSLLAATVDLDCAIPIIPAGEFPAIFMEYAPTRVRRRLGVRQGTEQEELLRARQILDAALAPIVPRNLAPVTLTDRITLVAAEHDHIVGGPPVHRLAEAWGVECWTYQRGHITVMTAPGIGPRLHGRIAETLARPRSAGDQRRRAARTAHRPALPEGEGVTWPLAG